MSKAGFGFSQVPLGPRRFWGVIQANFMEILLNLKEHAGKNRDTVYFSYAFCADDLGVGKEVLAEIFKHWEKQKLVVRKGRTNYNQIVCELNIEKIEGQWAALDRIRHEIIRKVRPENREALVLYSRRKITFNQFVKQMGFTKESIKGYMCLPDTIEPTPKKFKAYQNSTQEPEHKKRQTTVNDVLRGLRNNPPDVLFDILETNEGQFLYHLLESKHGSEIDFNQLDKRVRNEKCWMEIRSFFSEKMLR